MKDSLILKYFEGTLDDNGISELREWLEESDDHLDYFLSLEEAYLEMTSMNDMKASCTDEEWNRFLDKSGSARQSKIRLKFIRIAGIAAAAACLFMLGRRTGTTTVQVAEFDGTTVIETSVGQQSNMTLPDGTTVLLNDCSKLTYNPLEWKTERTVKLVGQASFEVVHMDNLPFKVASGSYEVYVLGTGFDISCYPEDKFSTVSLKHGKVEVNFHSLTDSAILAPGETLTYDNSSNVFSIDSLPEEITYSWEHNTMIFCNHSLHDKKNELQRHYGYVFEISDKCSGFTYNGEFKGDNIHGFMDIIETITPNLKYSINDSARIVKVWL